MCPRLEELYLQENYVCLLDFFLIEYVFTCFFIYFSFFYLQFRKIPNLTKLPALTILDLSHNELNGSVSSLTCLAPTLKSLNISNNFFDWNETLFKQV